MCRHKNISRSTYARGDESATDFAYAMALFRRGYDEHTIRQRILSERSNWKNHMGEKRMRHYLGRTVKRAKAIASDS